MEVFPHVGMGMSRAITRKRVNPGDGLIFVYCSIFLLESHGTPLSLLYTACDGFNLSAAKNLWHDDCCISSSHPVCQSYSKVRQVNHNQCCPQADPQVNDIAFGAPAVCIDEKTGLYRPGIV